MTFIDKCKKSLAQMRDKANKYMNNTWNCFIESLRWSFAVILGLLLYLLAADVIYLLINNQRWAEGLRDLLPFGIIFVVYKAILKIRSPLVLAMLIACSAIGLRIEDYFSPLSPNSKNGRNP